ncbi:MAG: signal peptide peptidase SppA [candidate division Zixibacteria bacterium]|nr:signal peptide peptidase SppA [candidate division Zixibacteria bacterium]
MARRSDWIIGGVLVASGTVLFLMLVLVFSVLFLGEESDLFGAGRRIALVEVHGPIDDSREVVEQIARYREDGSVPAIVLRVDSPGGVVAPTQEIFDELRKTREAGKVIVASMGSVAASGGYYISCVADSIVANPGTLTGSIGVIFELPNAEELLRKIGVDWEVVKSGPHKDIGSLTRRMTYEERRLMQSVVDDVYNQFVDVVSRYRPLSRDEVIELADGRVFTGNQAHSLRLVDRIGTYEDAIQVAARMVGITGRPRILRERQKTFLERLVEGMDTSARARSWGFLEYRLR